MKLINKMKSLITTESDCNNDCYQGRVCNCGTVEHSVLRSDLSKKILKGKEQKGLDLREVLEKFSIPRNSSRK